MDSTVALQLDQSYVKAYQRRAFARKALQQYLDAKSDYEQVLRLEPKNTQAHVEIAKIEDYIEKIGRSAKEKEVESTFDPKKMFESAGKSKKHGKGQEKAKASKKVIPVLNQSQVENKSSETLLPQDHNERLPLEKSSEPKQEGITVVEETSKTFAPPSFRSPLPREYVPVVPVVKPPHLRSKVRLSYAYVPYINLHNPD